MAPRFTEAELLQAQEYLRVRAQPFTLSAFGSASHAVFGATARAQGLREALLARGWVTREWMGTPAARRRRRPGRRRGGGWSYRVV